MTLKIRRAAVLGAGVMGAQIAAHLAAAGIRTHLLDLASDQPPEDKKLAKKIGKNFRNTRALVAMEQMKSMKPSPLMTPSVLESVIPGNFDDDFSVLAECDWVVEAVIERLDIKKNIHKKIAEYVRPGTPVCTNTSGISLADMTADLPGDYLRTFMGTHFFNPPRYMHLLEVIPHDLTDPALMTAMSQWIAETLGKGIVQASDTVNFIANRIGVFTIQATLKHMEELNLNIETVDSLTGKLMGRPASGTLRTMDVVGLDTFSHVAQNVYDRAEDDPYRDHFLTPQWIKDLIAQNHLGSKTGSQGCYSKSKDAKGKRVILAYRPQEKTYEEQEVQTFAWQGEASKIRDLVKRLTFISQQDDAGAQFVWRILRDTMSYSALLLEEIAGGDVKPLDEAIRWGFNWEYGPFELWQAMGYSELRDRMKQEGVKLPVWSEKDVTFYSPAPGTEEHAISGYQEQYNCSTGKREKVVVPQHVITVPNFATDKDPRVIASNKSASLLDIGEGVALLAFHTKMNAIDDDLLAMTQKAVATVRDGYQGLVIGNQGRAFSAGANLKFILDAIEKKEFDSIDQMLRVFQGTMQLLKYAPFPVVACPHGMTLGGGCEVTLHSSHRVVAGEAYVGLVEAGVGLIPAAGGTKELALRAYDNARLGENADPLAFLQRAFMLIGMGQVSTSGFDAVRMGLYPQTNTHVSISRDHQLIRAKGLAFQAAKMGYQPPTPRTGVKVAGDPGIQTFKMMLYNMVEGRQISPHDALIGEKVATVLCGGDIDAGSRVDEQYFLDLERRVFLELCQEEKTKERIAFMLKKGKPLRN